MTKFKSVLTDEEIINLWITTAYENSSGEIPLEELRAEFELLDRETSIVFVRNVEQAVLAKLTPNMFWDECRIDDSAASSVDELVHIAVWEMDGREGFTLDVQRAIRLPNQKIRITEVTQVDDDLNYRFEVAND